MMNSGEKPETAVVQPFPVTKRKWLNTDIINGVKANDPSAGQALYDRFHKIVCRRVRRILGTDSECEDVIQQVFLRLVKSIGSVREPALLDRWVDRITINTVRKEFRRRKRRWYIGYVSEPPETVVSSNQEATLLFARSVALLDTMKPDERIAFVLRFVMEEDISKIADICDWSLSTTKRRIAAGRDHFLKKAQRDTLLTPVVEGLSDE